MQKTRRFIALWLALILCLTVACPHKLTHQERVDAISKVVDTFSTSYIVLLSFIADAKDAGTITGANLAKVQSLVKEADPVVIKVLRTWKLVPNTDADVEAFIFSQDFQHALALAIDLSKIAGATELNVQFAAVQGDLNALRKNP